MKLSEKSVKMRLTAKSLLVLGALSAQSAAYIPGDNQQQPLVPGNPVSHYEVVHTHTAVEDAPSYRTPLLSLHRNLVNVPSISGSEGPVAHVLEKLLTNLNYTVQLQRIPSSADGDDAEPRYNVLAWPGTNSTRTLHGRVLITSHIDVVPPYLPYALNRTTIPPSEAVNFTALHPSTLISGRGSVDAKASVAAQITATNLLLESGALDPESVVLLFVVGEETSGIGMKFFSASLSNHSIFSPDPFGTSSSPSSQTPDRPQFKSAIFGEPTTSLLACGHKGITTLLLTATGRAGHSGYPWLGRSATSLLVRALNKLLDADLGSSERYGNTTVNVGVIEGGVAANVIAKEASARVAIRIAVGDQKTGAGVVVRDDGCELRDGRSNLEGDHVSYLYGPGSILVAHGDDEGLTVGELEEAVEGYKRLIKHAVEAS
ncbi:hypothetical protein NEMBOFW57_010358 [Staphylotrichum longicolle]|uniref:Peptidase M20 dimerisation domain-containing protein n=1 Tax=Staphylotrichum longicolle TaxID=669026 RepID=A0AAD4EN05_9PEZI|nr:hypothetical protein NEMBOFW57_010358 [Staphylotrichum longicolle]